MVKKGTEIQSLKSLVIFLERAARANNAKIWRKTAELLSKPTRRRAEVNLNKISKFAEGATALTVPGKVLSLGELKGKGIIAAWRFSKKAKEKLQKAGYEILTIQQLVEKNSKGSGVRIVI